MANKKLRQLIALKQKEKATKNKKRNSLTVYQKISKKLWNSTEYAKQARTAVENANLNARVYLKQLNKMQEFKC